MNEIAYKDDDHLELIPNQQLEIQFPVGMNETWHAHKFWEYFQFDITYMCTSLIVEEN